MSPHPHGAWLDRIDLAFVDRRFGSEAVDRYLQKSAQIYGPPFPHLDPTGRLVAMHATRTPDGPAEPTTFSKLVVRLHADDVELACTCTRGKSYLCAHVTGILVDLAASPSLRAALLANEPTEAHVEGLPRRRRDVFEDRSLEDRLALWLPPRIFEDDFELDVTVSASTGVPSADPRPAIFLRHRRASTRLSVKPRDVQAARLLPRHRRLVELTVPSSAHRDALVATGAQASLLLHLLREESPIFARGYRSRLRFSKAIATPRIEAARGPDGDRLVARWYGEDGALLCDAEDGLLFAGPFPYLWSSKDELFHALSNDVDLDVAWGLQRVPSLPFREETAARIGTALLGRARGLGVSLPSPETFGLAPLETTRFSLRLEGSTLDVRADLVADYGARTEILDPKEFRAASKNREDPEARAFDLVRRAGLFPDGADALGASEEAAVDFWRQGVFLLESSTDPPIAIVVGEGLVRGRLGDPLRATVDASFDTGWLDVTLTFTAGAVAVELAQIRKALAAQKRWLALDDGTLAKITNDVHALVGDAIHVFGATRGESLAKKRLPLHHLPRVERWIEDHQGTLDPKLTDVHRRLTTETALPEPTLPKPFHATLRPYQRDGVAWLELLRTVGVGGILADDMGLGKTLMTLTMLAQWKDASGRKPSLVVCPTSLLGNWQKEAARFTPSLDVLLFHGAPDQRARSAQSFDACDLVVTTYGVLLRDARELAKTHFRAVILDEAQNIKNVDARTTRAAYTLSADLRLALSGTPIENRLGELWSIANFVNPGMLGTRRDFQERFEHPITMNPDGATAAHLQRIVRPFVLRRTKAEVLTDLPPKIEIERACVLGARQKRLYDALALTLRKSVKKNIEKRGFAHSRLTVLTAILRLRQMACDPRLIDPNVPKEHSAKREVFLDLVREIAATGRRALVFSQFVELFDLWRPDLECEKIAYDYLDGSSTRREAIVDRFQNGSAPLFLVSLKAGGAGLNLTAADTVIHCDPWWNPAAQDQATDRAHRIGQTRAVTVVHLFAQGTIEEKIALLKQRKRTMAKAVLDRDDVNSRVESDEEASRDLTTDVTVDEALSLLEVPPSEFSSS